MLKRSLKDQIIIGIDPGTRITGYGIIQSKNGKLTPLDFGAIYPPKNADHSKKYFAIFSSVLALIEKFSPEALAVETQFVQKNIQSALKLGMARGAVLIAAAQKDIPVFEYAPRKAKLSITGSGSASKSQVQKMLQTILFLSELPTPEDAADGLALALCHAQQTLWSSHA